MYYNTRGFLKQNVEVFIYVTCNIILIKKEIFVILVFKFNLNKFLLQEEE